jgi:hypothetical protein
LKCICKFYATKRNNFYKLAKTALVVSIIFISDEGEAVSLLFRKNVDLDRSHRYGTWNAKTNEIDLNSAGWEFFEANRKQIRKLKPLLQLLEKFEC